MYIPNRAEDRYQALVSGDMHLCSGKSAPAPPDYTAAAEQTAAGNLEQLDAQTRANRPDQFTPFGSVEWQQDEQGNWTQNTLLNPDSQAALDAQLDVTRRKAEQGSQLYGRVEEDFADRIDYSGVTEFGDIPQAGQLTPEQLQRGVDFSGAEQRTGAEDARQQAEDAIYGRATSRLDPQWEQRSSQMEAKLAAQGLRPGDKAYDQAMENMGRERTDAYQQAQYGSIMGGGQEATRTVGMQREGRAQDLQQELASGQFGNQAAQQAFAQQQAAGGQNFAQQSSQSQQQSQQRQAQMSEIMQQRGFNLNEINALLTGQQVGMPQMTSFNQAGRVAGTDYSGATGQQYQGQLDQFSADQALMQGLMSGAGGMAMMSDRRLKKNVTKVGLFKQYPCYLFQYIWGQWAIGVMADEVNDEAVFITPSGYAAVDYARIM